MKRLIKRLVILSVISFCVGQPAVLAYNAFMSWWTNSSSQAHTEWDAFLGEDNQVDVLFMSPHVEYGYYQVCVQSLQDGSRRTVRTNAFKEEGPRVGKIPVPGERWVMRPYDCNSPSSVVLFTEKVDKKQEGK